MALKPQYRAIFINYLDLTYETHYCGEWRDTEQEALDDIPIEYVTQDPVQAWTDIKGNYCARQFTHARLQKLFTVVPDPPAPEVPATEPAAEPVTEPAPTEPAPSEPIPDPTPIP